MSRLDVFGVKANFSLGRRLNFADHFKRNISLVRKLAFDLELISVCTDVEILERSVLAREYIFVEHMRERVRAHGNRGRIDFQRKRVLVIKDRNRSFRYQLATE